MKGWITETPMGDRLSTVLAMRNIADERAIDLTRMKSERLRRGWTQQRLAVEAGVGYADISALSVGCFVLSWSGKEDSASFGLRPR